jgi:type IX secretion system PorP/SprF family membrane protein
MKLIILLLFSLLVFSSFSQQKYKFKQYMIHQTLYNPGFVDTETKYSYNSLYRRQWLRQENYPESFFAYGHYNFDPNHSVSGLISNDLINKFNQFEISASYVYNIELGYDYNLGMGIKAGYNEQNLLDENLTYFDPIEPTLNGNFTNRFMNFGTGISLSSNKLNVHLALPYLLGNNFLSKEKNFSLKSNHLYASLGYKIRISDWLVIYPNSMLYAVRGSKFHGSLNVNVLSNQLFWYGMGVDSDLTVNLTLGLFTLSGFRVIYVIDNKFFPANQTTGFSHEMSVSYAKSLKYNAFKKKKTKRFRR